MVFVQGTQGRPFSFGEGERLSVDLPEFFIATVPVTKSLWRHIMGPAGNPEDPIMGQEPMEQVSWDDIAGPIGFLHKLNTSGLADEMTSKTLSARPLRFRLPSETEWEYAARGGTNWQDGFSFSGSNDINAVAWYDRNSNNHVHEVAQKEPNQLALYDMSGNVWEWCQDSFTRDISKIPTDGKPFTSGADDRTLRGGCYHNWSIHCTVSKRYEIARDYSDGCIGFRLAMSVT
jgi:formylglycine-generating enzyme